MVGVIAGLMQLWNSLAFLRLAPALKNLW